MTGQAIELYTEAEVSDLVKEENVEAIREDQWLE